MSILENALVKKYFGCDEHTLIGIWKCAKCTLIADRILHAMQTPIKHGERYIRPGGIPGEFIERVATDDIVPDFHPWMLRLPDSFQPKQECDGELKCPKCGSEPGFTCRMPKQECQCHCFLDHQAMKRANYVCRCVACECSKPATDKAQELPEHDHVLGKNVCLRCNLDKRTDKVEEKIAEIMNTKLSSRALKDYETPWIGGSFKALLRELVELVRKETK